MRWGRSVERDKGERNGGTIDMPWRNFPNPKFRTEFKREMPLLLEITEFPFNTV